MTRRNIKAFIRALERGRAAIVKGNTGCQDARGKNRCWRCAMKYHSDVSPEVAYGLRNPDGSFVPDSSHWSLDRAQSDTITMFDNSIAALRRTLNGKSA